MIGISKHDLEHNIKYDVRLAALRLSQRKDYEEYKSVFDAVAVAVAKAIADNNQKIERDIEELAKKKNFVIKGTELF